MKTSKQIDAENISKLLAIPFDHIKTLDSLNRHYYRNIKAFNLLFELDPEVWKRLISEMSTIKENLDR